MSKSAGSTQQAALDVGDTTKPILIKDRRRVTVGDIHQLAMCAHRFDPGDLMGWHTHEFDDILRELICSNVASVIARLSPHCRDRRGELPELHPSDDLWVGDRHIGPKQSTLIEAENAGESGENR